MANYWNHPPRKALIDECLRLKLKLFKPCLKVGGGGVIRWGEKQKIGYSVQPGKNPVITLHYIIDSKQYHYEIQTAWSMASVNGQDFQRPWFICPAIRRGMACRRRCTDLYLPDNCTVFACRKCYQLGYESQLESARMRAFARIYDFSLKDLKKRLGH